MKKIITALALIITMGGTNCFAVEFGDLNWLRINLSAIDNAKTLGEACYQIGTYEQAVNTLVNKSLSEHPKIKDDMLKLVSIQMYGFCYSIPVAANPAPQLAIGDKKGLAARTRAANIIVNRLIKISSGRAEPSASK